jgi:hypothetical protein
VLAVFSTGASGQPPQVVRSPRLLAAATGDRSDSPLVGFALAPVRPDEAKVHFSPGRERLLPVRISAPGNLAFSIANPFAETRVLARLMSCSLGRHTRYSSPASLTRVSFRARYVRLVSGLRCFSHPFQLESSSSKPWSSRAVE